MIRRFRTGSRRLSRPGPRAGWNESSTSRATPVEPFADSDLLMLQRQRRLPWRRSGVPRLR